MMIRHPQGAVDMARTQGANAQSRQHHLGRGRCWKQAASGRLTDPAHGRYKQQAVLILYRALDTTTAASHALFVAIM